MNDDLPSPPTPPSSDDPLATLVRAAAPRGFDAGFSERVLLRLEADREAGAPLTLALEKQFRRVVPLLAAASLAMAAYNWWSARGTDSSAIEAALNLPRVSIASAYSTSSVEDTGVPELP
jgi:hypothetical protein